jgi:hypothetical protein
LVLLATSACAVFADGLPGVGPVWDNQSDTWVAKDRLGRAVPTSEETGAPRADRTVAMFYFLWHESVHPGPFDNSKIIAADPDAMKKPTSPPWGPLHAPHHWGESIFGYYIGDDEGVLRKHAQMLGDAGVDVIVFDTSNRLTYQRNYRKLFEVFHKVRQEGNRAPAVAFLTPFWDPSSTVAELYDQLYSQKVGQNLWFQWEGKPLILANPKQVDARVQDFFTFRNPQPDYFRGPTGPDMWSWLEVYPQHVFRNSRGEKEQMSVGVAQNAVNGRLGSMSEPGAMGRSLHGGNYAEQWRRAIQEDPRVVFITGWNEWIAQRFIDDKGAMSLAGRKLKPGDSFFVDTYSAEFSRDIEPMQGGFGDAYYYQMIDGIRRYKGTRGLPEVKCTPIGIDGEFADWAAAYPVYRDTLGDPARRDHPGWQNEAPFLNRTGRNDLAVAKVSADDSKVCFYIQTREALTASDGGNWMLLFLDTDHSPQTGWLGYDFVLNRSKVRPGITTLERNEGNAYRWGSPVDITFRMAGNELELAIPRSALGLTGESFTVDFKWADNIQQSGEWSDFTLNGDVAPNDRFNFRANIKVSLRAGPTAAAR